jgi:ankyrin repeat protein
LIEVGASVNKPDANGKLPLSLAVGDGTTLKILLDKSAGVNAKNKFSRTPFHFAAFRGILDSVEELIKRGANTDAIDEDKLMLLFYSIQAKHPEGIKFLLEKSASVDDGEKLLCQAARSDLPECTVTLINFFINLRVTFLSSRAIYTKKNLINQQT